MSFDKINNNKKKSARLYPDHGTSDFLKESNLYYIKEFIDSKNLLGVKIFRRN